MKKIRLNFYEGFNPATTLMDWLLMLVALLLLAWMLMHQKILETHLREKTQLSANNHIKPVKQMDTQLADQIHLTEKVQQQLNLPWVTMLTALEQVKKANAMIDILSIEPNKNLAEIKLKGEAQQFTAITQLVDHLGRHPAFSQAELLSQHLEQDGSKVIYVFEIRIGWRV